MPALSAKAKLALVAVAAVLSLVLLIAVAGSLDGRARVDVGAASSSTTVAVGGVDEPDLSKLPVVPGPVSPVAPGASTLPSIQPVGPTTTAGQGSASPSTVGTPGGGTRAPTPSSPTPTAAPGASTTQQGATIAPTTAPLGPAVGSDGAALRTATESSKGVNKVPPTCSAYAEGPYTDVECGAGGNGLLYSIATQPGTNGGRIVSVWVDATTDRGVAVRRVLRAQGTWLRVRAVTGVDLGEGGEDLIFGFLTNDAKVLVDVVRPKPGGAEVVAHLDRAPNAQARVISRQIEVYRTTDGGDVVDVVKYDRGAYRVVRSAFVNSRPDPKAMNLTT